MIDIKYSYDTGDIDKLIVQFPVASRDAMESKITEALLFLERIVKTETPLGAGPIHLRDTIFHNVDINGEGVEGLLGTPAEYGEPVELGTKPHFPPIAPIKFWVEKKLGIEGKEADSVAFLIARKISKKGTEGAYMFGNAWDDYKSAIIGILDQIPDEILRRIQ